MADIRAAKHEPIPAEKRVEHSQSEYPKIISVRYDVLLHETVQNMVNSSVASGDMSFISHSQVVRMAMEEWVNGMELTEYYVKGDTRQAAYHVSKTVYDKFYEVLKGSRSVLFQRIMKTYLKNLQRGTS